MPFIGRITGDRTDRGQSTVIGAILLIVVTIILVSFVAVYVFDVGGSLESSSPQVSFTFQNTTDGLQGTHDGGQNVPAANVEIVVVENGENPTAAATGKTSDGSAGNTTRTAGADVFGEGPIKVGDNGFIADNVGAGDIVRIVYLNPDNDQGTTLAKYEG